MMLNKIVVLLAAAALFLNGCASTGGTRASVAGTDFTSKNELNSILTQPGPASFLDSEGLHIEGWELQGELPGHIGTTASSSTSQWLKPLQSIAATKAGMVLHTTQLDCVARQVGVFWLKNKKLPAREMYSFIASRCGVPEAHVSIQYLSGEVPAEFTEDKIWEQWQDDVAKSTRQTIGAGMKSAGAHFVRNETHAGYFLAVGERKLFLEPISQLVQDEKIITIRGELIQDAETLAALSTQGKYGYADCSLDASLKLPAFALTCKVDAESPNTKIDIQTRAPGRILGTQIAEIEVFNTAELPKGAVKWDYKLNDLEVAPGDLSNAVTHYANHVRSLAGMTPLVLEPQQSQTGLKALPHYFGAMMGQSSPIIADRIALGLLAGWDVKADVLSGNIRSAVVYGTTDPARYVEDMLSSAMGRSLILNSSASLLAASMHAEESPEAVVGILTTYEQLDRNLRDSHRARVLKKINEQKAAKGKPAARIDTDVSDLMARALKKFESGQTDLNDTLNDMLQKAANRTGASVQAFYIESSDIESIEWDDSFINNNDALQVAVAYNQADGEAWSRYVVFVLFVKKSSI